jgi:flagellar biosynthetic protein FliR
MEISLVQVFSTGLMISVRLTGLMLFAPFFGSAVIPARIKAVLVFAMTVMLYPLISSRVPTLNISEWPMMIITELIIGIGLGIATNLVFDGVQLAGQITSTQIGYSLANIMDPQTQVDSTVMAMFHQTIAMLIFLRLGVHFWILRALANSFNYLPPSTGHISAEFVKATLHAAAGVFSIGVQIAAPVLSATLLADVALGMLGKASPQLPLLVIGPAVKSILGMLILISALKYWPAMFEHMFTKSIGFADHLLHLAR